MRTDITQTTSRVISRIAALLITLATVCAPATAQVEPIEPMWMVATRDTPLRCGELSTFYEVATIKRNQVVRIDGRSSRWARVIYPENLFGFVRKEDARDVTLNEDGTGTLTISEMSSIKAPNRISGLTGSWRSIYLGDLKPNTTIKIVGEALSKDNQMVGYRVEPLQPPAVDHPPHGFVQIAALRVATDAEVEAHKAKLQQADAGQSTTGKSTDTPASGSTDRGSTDSGESVDASPQAEEGNTNPASSQNDQDNTDDQNDASNQGDETGSDQPTSPPSAMPTTPSTTPQDSEPDSTPAQPDNSLVEDLDIPTPGEIDEPAVAEEPGSESSEPNPESSGDSSASQPATAQQPVVTPAQRDYLRYEELEATLTRVRRAGGAVLLDSLDELVAEYERSLANADTPSIVQALSSRLSWLRARKDARDQRLALQAALRDAKEVKVTVQREQELWRTARGYDIVGRLVPSAIYDGTNLPRMFRIVVEGESGITRTIGYVRDDENLGVRQLVGSIVGVAGTARYDDSLRLRIITATDIERFRPDSRP